MTLNWKCTLASALHLDKLPLLILFYLPGLGTRKSEGRGMHNCWSILFRMHVYCKREPVVSRMSHWTLEQRVHGFTHIVTVAPSMQLKVCCDWFTVFEMNRFLWDFCIFNIIYMTNECFPKVSHHSIGLQVELILTAEDLLRLIGIHRRFISGRKTVEPNYKAWFQNERDEIEVQDDPDFCLDHSR